VLLREKAGKLSEAPRPAAAAHLEPADFNAASDEMDVSFHYLRTLLDEVMSAAFGLENL
jgi:hypothetical protein